jgi:hypothetical protein
MREWSVKSGKKCVENPPVVHNAYGKVFIRQAWCTDRPHSFCEPTLFHPIKKDRNSITRNYEPSKKYGASGIFFRLPGGKGGIHHTTKGN